MRNIGILGGTFDPVHKAHLELARAAYEQFELAEVLFVPTGQPVRKLGTTQASAVHRLGMLRAATNDTPEFKVSSIEVKRPQITYTIDTLRELKAHYGEGSQLYLILGEDTATDLDTWKDAGEIAQLATILYARRPGTASELKLPRGFTCYEVKMPESPLSSSGARTLLQGGSDASNCIPAEALAYIKDHGLYEQPQHTL